MRIIGAIAVIRSNQSRMRIADELRSGPERASAHTALSVEGLDLAAVLWLLVLDEISVSGSRLLGGGGLLMLRLSHVLDWLRLVRSSVHDLHWVRQVLWLWHNDWVGVRLLKVKLLVEVVRQDTSLHHWLVLTLRMSEMQSQIRLVTLWVVLWLLGVSLSVLGHRHVWLSMVWLGEVGVERVREHVGDVVSAHLVDGMSIRSTDRNLASLIRLARPADEVTGGRMRGLAMSVLITRVLVHEVASVVLGVVDWVVVPTKHEIILLLNLRWLVILSRLL